MHSMSVEAAVVSTSSSVPVKPSEFVSKGDQAREEGSLPLARTYYGDAAKIFGEQADVLTHAHTIRHIADIHPEEQGGGFPE